MDTTTILGLGFAIGVIAGLRAMTAPAAVIWAAHSQWVGLQDTWLRFFAPAYPAYIMTVVALGEIINDKLPKTPSRKAPGSFGARIVMGAFAGAAVGTAGHQSTAAGALVGALGAVAGTLGGYEARTRLVAALKVPDYVVALVEDAIAVCGAWFIVTRIT